ncbi:MAG: hypothetical protein IJ328_03320 [Muribaculaceae bacterium]|nr:hypothetical protein [Muribaculaceae bacterium]
MGNVTNFLDYAGLSRFWAGAKDQLKDVEQVDVQSNTAGASWTEAGLHARLLDALQKGRLVLVNDSVNPNAGYVIPARVYNPAGAPENATEASDILVEYSSPALTNDTVIRLVVRGDDSVSVARTVVSSNYASTSSLKMEYNSSATALELKHGSQVLASVDASPFIKDGMLDDTDTITVSAEDDELLAAGYAIGEKLIKFVWKGVYKTDENGNTVYDDKTGVPIPKTDYLRVSDIAVDPETDNTVVSENIIIAGGPLADEVKAVFASYKDGDGNTVIPKDMSIQEVLTLLVCKEMWPTAITTSDATLKSTVAAPTIAMSTSAVEVGTTVAYTVTNNKSGYTATPHKASGFTYGWSAADDNVKDGSETSKQAAFGDVEVVDDVSVLTVTATGKTAATKNGTSAAGSAEISDSITAVEGANTVTAKATSATYKGVCGALPQYFGCSNTGRTNDGTKNYPSAAKSEVELTSTSVTSSNTSKSFTAYYKYFMGCCDETAVSALDSAKVRALTSKTGNITKGGTTTIVNASSTWTSDGRSIVIACPDNYKLASVQDELGVDYKDVFTKRGKVQVNTGGGSGAAKAYKVYMYPITSGTAITLKNITLTATSNADEY